MYIYIYGLLLIIKDINKQLRTAYSIRPMKCVSFTSGISWNEALFSSIQLGYCIICQRTSIILPVQEG